MKPRKVICLVQEQDLKELTASLHNTREEADDEQKRLVWDQWDLVFADTKIGQDRLKPESWEQVTEADMEAFHDASSEFGDPIYFSFVDVEIPDLQEVNSHKVVSTMGNGIMIEPSSTTARGIKISFDNIGIGSFLRQVKALRKLNNDDDKEETFLVDVLQDAAYELEQYLEENPSWTDTVELDGPMDDQKGIAKKGEITGHIGGGIPVRKYTWITAKLSDQVGKQFEAADDQIFKWLV